MSNDRKLTILIILLALGLWAWASGSYSSLQREYRKEVAAHQVTILEAAGWKKAPSQPAEEIVLPALEEEVQAAAEAETDIAFVVSSRSEAVEVMIPLPSQPASANPAQPGASQPSDGVGSTTLLDSFLATSVDPSIQLRADLTALGELFYTGKILVHLSVPDLNFHSFTEHPLIDTQIALGPEVERALKYYYERPPRFTLRLRRLRHVRFGWSAGVGVSARPTGELYPSIAVLWGVQF